MLALCAVLAGCAASAPEVRARLGQEYIGKNVDVLVVKWGPPTNTFKLNSGQSSYVWQLASETDVNFNNGVAKTYACKVSVIASPAGVITQLDTEDAKAGAGILMTIGATGSICGERLGMKPQG
jgi:hypothetical protein